MNKRTLIVFVLIMSLWLSACSANPPDKLLSSEKNAQNTEEAVVESDLNEAAATTPIEPDATEASRIKTQGEDELRKPPIESHSQEEQEKTAIDTEPTNASEYSIGRTVRFGGYDWIIMDVRNGKALLLTESIIALRFGNITEEATEVLKELGDKTMPRWSISSFDGYTAFDSRYDGIYEEWSSYDDANPDTFSYDIWNSTWENCSLRAWLNHDMEFTDAEWNMIETTEVIDKTELGENTSDKVFLLDMDDVKKFFPRNEDRATDCKISDEELLEYLKDTLLTGTLSGDVCERAMQSVSGGDFYWWVRSSDNGDEFFLKPMSTDEALSSMSMSLKKPLGVRPAIWISIENLGNT